MLETMLQMKREEIYYEVNAVKVTSCLYEKMLKLDHYFRTYTVTKVEILGRNKNP